MEKSTVFSTADTLQQYRISPVAACSPLNVFSETYSGIDKVKRVRSVSVPNFWQLCRMGKFLPINHFLVETETETFKESSYADWEVRLKSNNACVRRGQGKVVIPSNYLEVPPVDTSILDVVATSALSRVQEAEWDVLTFLSELRSTVDTVRSGWRGIKDILFRNAEVVARLKRASAAERWNRFAQLWLEARYGWRPIMYDVHSAIGAYNSTLEDGTLISERASQTDSDSVADYYETVYDENTTAQFTRTMEYRRTYRAVAYLEVSIAGAKIYGANPLVTAWELTPWSFVADWFINVGDSINALSALASGRVKGVCVSVRESSTREIGRNIDWHDSTTRKVVGNHLQGCLNTLEVERYERFPYVGAPIPQVDINLNLPKLVDLAALVFGDVKQLRRRIAQRR